MSDIQERANRGELGDELRVDDIVELWWHNVEERPDNRPERCDRGGVRDLLKRQMLQDVKSGNMAARRSAIRLNEHTTRPALDTTFAPKEWLERGFGSESENKPSPQPEYDYAISRIAFVRWFKAHDYGLPDDTSLTKWLPELVEWIPDGPGPVVISTLKLPSGRGPRVDKTLYVNAELGKLDDHLFVEEIIALWFPTYMLDSKVKADRERKRIIQGVAREIENEITEAIKKEKLEARGYPKSCRWHMPAPDKEWSDDPGEECIAIYYLIHRDAFRTWLDSRPGHPPPDDCPLWSWWGNELPASTSVRVAENASEPFAFKVLRDRDGWSKAMEAGAKEFHGTTGRNPSDLELWSQLIDQPPPGFPIKLKKGSQRILVMPPAGELEYGKFKGRYKRYTKKS